MRLAKVCDSHGNNHGRGLQQLTECKLMKATNTHEMIRLQYTKDANQTRRRLLKDTEKRSSIVREEIRRAKEQKLGEPSGIGMKNPKWTGNAILELEDQNRQCRQTVAGKRSRDILRDNTRRFHSHGGTRIVSPPVQSNEKQMDRSL
jgi:hypothetical protein